VVLGQGHPGLGGQALGGGIAALEQLHGVRPQAEAHVLRGQAEHPVRLARQVEPKGLPRLPELDRLVPRERARGIAGEQRGQPGAGLVGATHGSQERDLEPARADRIRGLGHHGAEPLQCGLAPARARVEARQLQTGRGPEGGRVRGILPLRARAALAPLRAVGEAQQVLHLGVVARALESALEQGSGLGEALEVDQHPARGLQQAEALGEAPPAVGVGLEGDQPLALPLLLAPEIHEVAFAALFGRRVRGHGLRPQRDLAGRQGVVAVLGVGEEDAAVGRLEGQRVARGGRQPREGADQRAGRGQVETLLGHRPRAIRDPQPPSGDRVVHVHAHREVHRAVLDRRARQVDHGLGVGPRDPADLPHRHPVFGEADRLLGAQEAVGLLVAEEAGLDLHVGAVVVRERLPPVEAVGVRAPGPDLLRGRVLARRVVHDPGAGGRMPHPHEGLAAPVGEKGHGAVEVVAHDREVDALGVDRPGVHLAEAVGRGVAHRVGDPAVVVHADAGVVPPVEAPPHCARVVEGHVLLEERAARPQPQLHPPLHPVDPVHVRHPDGGAAVGAPRQREVHRGEGDPVVGDGKVELDAEGGPDPAVGDLRLAQGAVRVEHLRPRRLVHAGVEVAALVGEHHHPQVLVLQVQRAVADDRLLPGEGVAERVGVVEAAGGEEVERRIDVGRALLVGGKVDRGLPGFHLGGRGRSQEEGRGEEKQFRLSISVVHRPPLIHRPPTLSLPTLGEGNAVPRSAPLFTAAGPRLIPRPETVVHPGGASGWRRGRRW